MQLEFVGLAFSYSCIQICRCLRKIVKSHYYLHVRLSVCLEQLGSLLKDLNETLYLSFIKKICVSTDLLSAHRWRGAIGFTPRSLSLCRKNQLYFFNKSWMFFRTSVDVQERKPSCSHRESNQDYFSFQTTV
jgi:hypothetical protein